jgi:hypothetical protein
MKSIYEKWRKFLNEQQYMTRTTAGTGNRTFGTPAAGTMVTPPAINKLSSGADPLGSEPEIDSDEVVKAVVHRNSHVLLLQKRNNKYDLPGGHLHQGEGTEDGMAREFEEETGLWINPALFNSINLHIGNKTYFEATLQRDDINVNPEEHKDFGLFTLDQIEAMGPDQLKSDYKTAILNVLGGEK